MTEPQVLTFGESVRKRPGMYFGNNKREGIVFLMDHIIQECIELNQTTTCFLSISLNQDNDFSDRCFL
jgi:DNA gyrase/topoisomerase IV subunit B